MKLPHIWNVVHYFMERKTKKKYEKQTKFLIQETYLFCDS